MRQLRRNERQDVKSCLPGEAQQLVFVSPQDRLVLLDIELGHDIVQAHDHIFGSVSDDDEEASLLLLQPILNERRNARVPMISLA